jgi:hypothetical protein
MADGTKTSGFGRTALIAADTAACLATLMFFARIFYGPLYYAVSGRELTEFPLLMACILGAIGVSWLVRRHVVRMLRFQALIMSSVKDRTTIAQATRRLFDAVDVACWCLGTVVVASALWAVISPDYSSSTNRVPVQLIAKQALLPPAIVGGGWLILRSSWYPKLLPKAYQQIFELAEAINSGQTVRLDRFINALVVPSLGETAAKRLALEYGNADLWLEEMEQAAKERRRHSAGTSKEKAVEDVGPAYGRLCCVEQIGIGSADAICSLFNKRSYVKAILDLRKACKVDNAARV